jgi:two-component system KDP operon response regulator KdpE
MKILIVDDDEPLLSSISVALELHWSDVVVLQATDAEGAIRLFYDADPDLVLLDVGLRGGSSGVDVLREIRRVSDTPIVMLTARQEEADQVRALELGADDYLVKPVGHTVVIARIRAVLRRVQTLPPVRGIPDFTAGPLEIDFDQKQVRVHGEPVKLTPTEFKLLYHLVRNAGRVVNHRTLLDRVWGPSFTAGSEHLKTFISQLRKKIDQRAGVRYIETQRGLGYRFLRPPVSHPAQPSPLEEHDGM